MGDFGTSIANALGWIFTPSVSAAVLVSNGPGNDSSDSPSTSDVLGLGAASQAIQLAIKQAEDAAANATKSVSDAVSSAEPWLIGIGILLFLLLIAILLREGEVLV